MSVNFVKRIFTLLTISFFLLNSCSTTKNVPTEIQEQQQIEELPVEDVENQQEAEQKINEQEEIIEQSPVVEEEISELVTEDFIDTFEDEVEVQNVEEDTNTDNTENSFKEPEVLDSKEEIIEETNKTEEPLETEKVEDSQSEIVKIEEKTQIQSTPTTQVDKKEEAKPVIVQPTKTPVVEEKSTVVEEKKEIETPKIEEQTDTNEVENVESHGDETTLEPTDETEKSEQTQILPSRSMTCKNNQFIEVDYPGSGWIYIGENTENTHFRYFGRKLGTANTKFTLRSVKPGKTILHFYKNDILTSQYIDDYLEVEVLEESAKGNEKSIAPSYAEIVPAKPVRVIAKTEQKNSDNEAIKNQNNSQKNNSTKIENTKKSEKQQTQEESSENIRTIIQNKDAQNKTEEKNTSLVLNQDKPKVQPKIEETKETEIVLDGNSKDYLNKAKTALKEKKYPYALKLVQEYLNLESTKIDEALFVQGQILESDSAVKNIKNALDCYDTIIKKYPYSRFWDDANKRKIFLNKFYVNIY